MNGTQSLSILQINLGRSFQATKNINITHLDHKQDISFLQEPYFLKNKVIGFPLKTATIIHNENIEIFPMRTTQTMIIVKLTWNNVELITINCYFPPQTDTLPLILEIEQFLRQIQPEENVLLVGDFNSKNTIWGGEVTDKRGLELAEFVNRHDLNVLNDPQAQPTFQTKNGRSWIDLTICSTLLLRQLRTWEVMDEESGSDHRYIKVEFFEITSTKEKRLTKMGEKKVLDALCRDLWIKDTAQRNIENKNQLEIIVTQFYKKIEDLKKKFAKNVKKVDQKQKPWWKPELEIQRKKVRAMRRRYQRCTEDLRNPFKSLYLEGLKQYQKEIQDAKNKSWKDYCSKQDKNPFSLPYKIAADKIKREVVFQSLIKENGEETKTKEETVRYILQNLYGTEATTSETMQNDSIHKETEDDAREVIEQTELEVDHVINNIRRRISPGPDQINTGFIQSLYHAHKQFFIKIFNAALLFGHFPSAWKTSKVILIPVM